MRKLLLLVALVCIGAAGAAAQDYIFTDFTMSRALHPIAAPTCPLLGPAQPLVYDRSAWLFYTCTDGTVIPLRFYHPNDNVVAASPVIPPAPAPIYTCQGTFVRAQGGGCVPPDHPLAVR